MKYILSFLSGEKREIPVDKGMTEQFLTQEQLIEENKTQLLLGLCILLYYGYDSELKGVYEQYIPETDTWSRL